MDDLQRLAARITSGWERWTRSQRIAVIALCAAGAVGISLLRQQSDDSDWQPIATGREFSAKEISAIQSAWRRQGLSEFRRVGGMLSVPQAELAKYQAALPKAVAAEPDSTSEWDKQLSGVNAFTSSEQLEQRKDNALRNELRRVLRAIPSIAEADVIWARGKSRSTFGGRGKVTATVNITPKDGHDLTPELGQSLRSAVASMIADLNPADIVVLDQSTGLAVPFESDATWTARLQQRQAERSAKQLEQQIATALADRGDVKVSIERCRSRETSDVRETPEHPRIQEPESGNKIAWLVSVSVPEIVQPTSSDWPTSNQRVESVTAMSDLRGQIAALLPAEFSKAEIRIATHPSGAPASASQPQPFAAWPHLICAGIAALCVVFGLSSRSAAKNLDSSGEIAGVKSRTDGQEHRPEQTPAVPTNTREENRHANSEPVSNQVRSELTTTSRPQHQDSELRTLQTTAATTLAEALRHERPQAISVLATRLPSRLVSDTLARLPAETQREIICRLKTLGDVPDDLVTEIARTVCRRLAANSTPPPVNRIADVTASKVARKNNPVFS